MAPMTPLRGEGYMPHGKVPLSFTKGRGTIPLHARKSMEPEEVLSDEQIASIKQISQEVYKEEAIHLVIEGNDDEQEEIMRGFVERVALRVAAICLVQIDQSSDEAIEMHVGADDMTDLITNLLRQGNASIRLMITTE